MNTYDCPTPVMAINPYQNKMVNVEPLFDFLRDQIEMEDKADTVIKALTLSTNHEDVCEYDAKELILFMYDVRNMFRRLTECEISVPKKGGRQ